MVWPKGKPRDSLTVAKIRETKIARGLLSETPTLEKLDHKVAALERQIRVLRSPPAAEDTAALQIRVTALEANRGELIDLLRALERRLAELVERPPVPAFPAWPPWPGERRLLPPGTLLGEPAAIAAEPLAPEPPAEPAPWEPEPTAAEPPIAVEPVLLDEARLESVGARLVAALQEDTDPPDGPDPEARGLDGSPPGPPPAVPVTGWVLERALPGADDDRYWTGELTLHTDRAGKKFKLPVFGPRHAARAFTEARLAVSAQSFTPETRGLFVKELG